MNIVGVDALLAKPDCLGKSTADVLKAIAFVAKGPEGVEVIGDFPLSGVRERNAFIGAVTFEFTDVDFEREAVLPD